MAPYPGMFYTGDGAARDEDGYIWIKGRVDDVINVSGHPLSTTEIESALILRKGVAETAERDVDDFCFIHLFCFSRCYWDVG